MGYQFIMPKQVFYGEKALRDATASICLLGKKALVVTDPLMVKLGNAQAITDMLDKNNIAYCVFDGITGEPTDKMIDAGLDAYKKEHCDFLIAVGGGSPIDSMKAIGALVTSGGCINDYLGKVITVPAPTCILLPRAFLLSVMVLYLQKFFAKEQYQNNDNIAILLYLISLFVDIIL